MSSEPLMRLWWERLPGVASRCSHGLGIALAEGLYLTAWPRVAAVAPVLALLFGILAGWLRLGGTQVFTQSPLILVAAIGLGLVAGQLGCMFTAGYIAGDAVLWRNHGFQVDGLVDGIRLAGGLLVVYFALAMIAVGLPLAVRTLRAQTPLPSENAADIRVALEALFGGLFAAILGYLYVQALPMLIRPLFIWQGQVPSVESVAPVQGLAWLFALIALAVGSGRVLAEYAALLIDPGGISGRTAALDIRDPSFWQRLPTVVRVAAASLTGLVLLGGLVFTLTEAALLLGGLLLTNLIRSLLLPRFALWCGLVERIPAIVRLPAALGLGYVVSAWVLSSRLSGQSFIPLIWALLAVLLCVALLFPESRGMPNSSDQAPTTRPHG